MEDLEKGKNAGNPWWSCLWACLVITALVLGIAALWMPLERHLKIENSLEDIRLKHLRIESLIESLRYGTFK